MPDALTEAVARAIGSPFYHDQPAGEDWWRTASEGERYNWIAKAEAALGVMREHVRQEVEQLRSPHPPQRPVSPHAAWHAAYQRALDHVLDQPSLRGDA